MDNRVQVPDRVQWSEGMLLTPQHFQQDDIYWHALLTHQMSQLQPYYWGLLDLKIDEAAIRTGKVRVLSLHAVMPDGLIVQYPAPGQDDSLMRDVSTEAALRENKPLKIHLVVPVRTEGAASRSSSIQRYDSTAGELELDENTGQERTEVCRLRPRLDLFAGDKVPAKYVSLPLLELRRDLGGHFNLTEYHPPLLRTGASRFLGDAGLAARLATLTTQIRSKARELLGIADGENRNGAGNGNGTARSNLIAQRLVSGLPALEVLVRSGCAHPFNLYVALAQLVGQMAGVGGDPVPMLLDSYRHDDLAPGFHKTLRHLTAVLSKLNAAYEVSAFERANDDTFAYAIGAETRPERLIVELKPSNGQTPQALTEWLTRACVGSAPLMPLLRQRRLSGARVRPLPPDQITALGVSGGAFYEIVNQAVEQDGKLVPVIRPGMPLHIVGSTGTSAPSAIVLYTPNPRHKKTNGANHG
ncbi:MAG TPA: type VI secretion system baseplate subunit TssK [Burkholderiales bacterium]|nr:type VI secretion system baseplate subunit TssK [Burkholderiales bacterium]